jgi:flagellar biosynthetic protein FlhB
MEAGAGVGWVVLVVFAVAAFCAILANVMQFGFLFSPVPFKPNFGKLNPINGAKNLFSKRILVNLGKQLLKLGAVGLIVYTTISGNLDLFERAGQSTPEVVIISVFNVIFTIAWKFGMLLVFVGLLDYAYERWQLEESLKMTKTEVKDEARQSEGSPEAKMAFKKRQREFARRRMMNAVPRATVVVTNPTHFAIAIEWDEEKHEAPVVIAKGADLLAKRIREIAIEHGVPIMENPPLARTLYDKVEIDHPIPPNLYAAVAQVIAFVYKLKRKIIA